MGNAVDVNADQVADIGRGERSAAENDRPRQRLVEGAGALFEKPADDHKTGAPGVAAIPGLGHDRCPWEDGDRTGGGQRVGDPQVQRARRDGRGAAIRIRRVQGQQVLPAIVSDSGLAPSLSVPLKVVATDWLTVRVETPGRYW